MNATDLHDAEIAEFLSAVRAALDALTAERRRLLMVRGDRPMKITLIALIAAAALVAPAMAFAQGGKTTMETEAATKPTPTKSGHIKANGVNY
jgi:hypothetical protein